MRTRIRLGGVDEAGCREGAWGPRCDQRTRDADVERRERQHRVAGLAIPREDLGNVDTVAPFVNGASLPDLTTAGGSTYRFSVTYSDNVGT